MVAVVANDFDSLPRDAQKAAFAHIDSGESSARADAASKAANSPGKGQSKYNKAEMHKTAAFAHKAASLKHAAGGNKALAKAHKEASKEHAAKAEALTGNVDYNNFEVLSMDRNAKVQAICANCSCYKGKEQLLGNKSLFADSDLDALIENLNERKTLMLAANAFSTVAAKAGVPTGMALNEAVNLVVNAMDDEDSELEEEDEEVVVPVPKKKKKGVFPPPAEEPTGNTQEWLSKQPPEVRSAVTNAMQIEKDTKFKIVSKLVGNIADESVRNARGNALMKKTLPELQEIAALIPATSTTANQQTQQPQNNWFFGMNGTPPIETNAANDADDIASMTQPTTNWQELAASGRNK